MIFIYITRQCDRYHFIGDSLVEKHSLRIMQVEDSEDSDRLQQDVMELLDKQHRIDELLTRDVLNTIFDAHKQNPPFCDFWTDGTGWQEYEFDTEEIMRQAETVLCKKWDMENVTEMFNKNNNKPQRL